MSLNLFDRVKETCSAPGTGTVTLLGAVTGFQSFAIVGNANTCYYTIADQYGANWEVGIGTYTLSGTTLARTTVLSSSAGGTTKANFATGIQDVFVTYPAEKAVYVDATSNVNLGTNALINVSHIGINTTTTPNIALRAIGDNNTNSRMSIRGYSSDANSSAIRVTKFRGTEGAPQAPLSGDSLGKFELAGYGTTSSDGYPQASFEGVATENWGATARGSKTVFKVTPNTTTTQVIAFTLDQDKSASFAGALSVTGHTTFEGVTSTGATGTGKLVYDTSPTLTTPIFTTNITSPLVIGGTTASSTLILESTSGTGTTDYISFRTASQSERFRVGNAGQWGIGGATYGTAGQAFLSGGASAAPTWGTLGVGGGGTGLTSLTANYIPYGNGTSAFSSTSAFTYTSTGLGVGTSATSIIDCRVDQASTTYLTVQNRYHAASTTQSVGIKLQLGDISESFKWCYVNAIPLSAYESGAALAFGVYNGTTPAEVMRMYPTGGVSIGNTTDPGAGSLSVNATLLEVTGSAWTAYTPTITTDTGTFGTPSTLQARYRKLGKTVFASYIYTASVSSGSPTQIRVTYPTGASGVVGVVAGMCYVRQNGVNRVGTCTQTTNTYFTVAPIDGTAYSGLCSFQGTFTFEVA